MKRDLDLIRAILLAIEAKSSIDPRPVDVAGYPTEHIGYHVELLHDAGYLKGVRMAGFGLHPTALTWQGHEFLDAARNDSVWTQLKTELKDKRLSLPIAVVQDLATKIAAALAGL